MSERDCTAEFAATTNAWIEESERFRDDLAAVIGEKAVEERQADRRAQLAAVGAGVLRRSLFRAVRP